MRFIGFISAAALAACASSTPPTSTATTTTTAYVPAVTNDHAIEEITRERCAREFSCDNIGAGRVWRDYPECIRDTRLRERGMLRGQTCINGVDAYQLSSCINDIRHVHCAVQGDIERFASCAETKLCR